MKAAQKALLTLSLLVLSSLSVFTQAQPVRASYSSVELVSEVASVKPGETFTLGLIVTPDPSWHNYWVNPGEAGKEMKVRWNNLAEGVEVGDFVYQVPHVTSMGGIITYGFAEQNIITMDVTVPEGFAEESLLLAGQANYLVCDDANCVPQSAPVFLSLPIGDGALNSSNDLLFQSARDHQPQMVDWDAAFYSNEDLSKVSFDVAFAEPGASDIYVWPTVHKMVIHTLTQTPQVKDGLLSITMDAGRRLERYQQTDLLITYKDANGNEQAGYITGVTKASGPGAVSTTANSSTGVGSNTGDVGILWALGAAFLGGLILNLMPCVLPVLSLKMLSLAKMGESHPRVVRTSGIYYTTGVILSFVALAIVVIAIKSAGEAASWGFQLQNPIVVLGLVLLMTLIGLNLLGVFEFGTGMMNVGSNLTSDGDGHSKKSSFWTGVLAVVVATPCTAPFMAGALGYAFTQPVHISLLVFVFLGLGLAFPYLLIAFVPGARRIVPNPGPWMSVFKTALAFPMFGTAAWLVWVLGDKDTILWTLFAMLAIALAAWAWGKVPVAARPNAWRVTAVVFLVGTLYLGNTAIERKESSLAMAAAEKVRKTQSIKTINALKAALQEAARTGGQLNEQAQALLGSQSGSHDSEMPFSEKELMALLDNGQHVFAYFTADWCVSCKVNEKASLHKDATLKFFADHNIQVMVGDHTDGDPEIDRIIELYKHPGVPLYLYYKPGDRLQDGRKLPQLLPTPSVLIDGIKAFRG
ncbi:thioredoxin family protein [bacterium SCSIO 12696]|nr:thioredoxin family protein [bacterium SCSIO 12696]